MFSIHFTDDFQAESTDGRDHVRDRILHNHMERVIRIHRDDSEVIRTSINS